MTIDPATGEGNNTDESAITVTGYDRMTGKIFLLDAWDKRVLPFDLTNMIIQKARAWKPHVIAPEDVSFQKTYKHFLRQEMDRAGVHFPIRPVKPGNTGKGARILDSLQPFIANQQLYVMRNRAHRKVIDEAINVQIVDGKVVGRSPNLLDSLAYHADFWRGQIFATDEDRDERRMYKSEQEPAYGLSCVT